MEQRRNERVGETGDPRGNPPTNGIVQCDSKMRNPESTAMLISHMAEGYTTRLQVDLTQGFQKCSFCPEKPIHVLSTGPNAGFHTTRLVAVLPALVMQARTAPAPRQGNLPGFAQWESCRTMPSVGGAFSGISVPPPPPPHFFHSGAALYSLQSPSIGSQDLAVKSRTNLFTDSLTRNNTTARHLALDPHQHAAAEVTCPFLLRWQRPCARESRSPCQPREEESYSGPPALRPPGYPPSLTPSARDLTTVILDQQVLIFNDGPNQVRLIPYAYAVRPEHCAPIQSLVLSGDGALDTRVSVALIAPALLGLRRGRKFQAGGGLKAGLRLTQHTSVELCGLHTLQACVEPVDKEMARVTDLSDFDKGVIVGCHLSGLSSRAIARKSHSSLKREIVKNRAQPVAAIRQEFHTATEVSVSFGTLRTEAHRLGYFVRAAAHKPHITTSNKARRLRWCLDRRNWTLEHCKSVLWRDESRFTLFRSDGRVWVWRLPGERLLPECIVPTRKFGGGGVMVWGCFTAFGVGPLVYVCGSMNTEAYCNILDDEMLPTLWRFYGIDPCYFQDDNAMCRVSRSPDLNPIEHLWDELDRRVRARKAPPKSIAELMESLLEELRRIPVDVLQTLVESMPVRVATVIAGRVITRYESEIMMRRRNISATGEAMISHFSGFCDN
ncbi:hypothetical protein PR048_026253 [Dryococelus australis]|uniref:Transposase n=1 Tax=Dryococelus australis TaxID=614101 RepID=A0ABQ9GKU1_9NEOP|nr:hypothetical protein PR048_026253 [Dryococelus australis]